MTTDEPGTKMAVAETRVMQLGAFIAASKSRHSRRTFGSVTFSFAWLKYAPVYVHFTEEWAYTNRFPGRDRAIGRGHGVVGLSDSECRLLLS